jgi:hypothetical protein
MNNTHDLSQYFWKLESAIYNYRVRAQLVAEYSYPILTFKRRKTDAGDRTPYEVERLAGWVSSELYDS